MSNERSGLLITLPARPENVAVVRHALAGLAAEVGMDEPAIGDLKTVVTEACMNVVVHAYDGDGPGPLEVEATPEQGGLTVSVRDFGRGIRPHPGDERQSLRIGLTLIAALSSSFSISGGLGRGTEVTMHVPLSSRNGDGDSAGVDLGTDLPAEAAALRIDDRELVAPVLERVVGVLAARHPIGVDRLNDAMLLTDAVSDGAPEAFDDGRVRVTVADGDGGLDLRVGPLVPGGGEQLRKGLAVPDVGGSLENLADEVRVEVADSGEYLVVRFDSMAS